MTRTCAPMAMTGFISSLLAACASGGAGSQDLSPPPPVQASGPVYKTCPLGGFSGFLTCLQYKDNLDELNELLLQQHTSGSSGNLYPEPYPVSPGGDSTPPPLPPAFPTTNPLSYASWGPWAADGNPMAAPTGMRTPADAIPKTGTAIFTGHAIGTLHEAWATGEMLDIAEKGTVTLRVDFANSQVRTDFNLDSLKGAWVAASLSGNTYSGSKSLHWSASDGTPVFQEHSVSGAFFGPTASETAGTYKFIGGGPSFTATNEGTFGAKLCPAGPAPC